jgi:hypothetical protein
MTVSSRTPEGIPNRCPVCGSEMRIEPSMPGGDAPCPKCGSLVWFRGPGYLQPCRKQHPRPYVKAILVLAIMLAAAGWYYLALFQRSMPETCVMVILGVLLFGRRLPDVGFWIGRELWLWRHRRCSEDK